MPAITAESTNGYLTHATGWYNGDFNYDGVVNGSDYTLIDNAFNTQGAALPNALVSPQAVVTTEIAGSSAVPEPTTFALLATALPTLLDAEKGVMVWFLQNKNKTTRFF